MTIRQSVVTILYTIVYYYPFMIMRKLLSAFLVVPAFILLTGCAANDVPPAEDPMDAMPKEDTTMQEEQTFSGENSEMDESQSTLSFVGGSSIVDHPGVFEDFDVSLTLDDENPEDLEKASLNVVIDATTVKTDSAGLDGHLMKEDFFDTENYPEIMFASTSIRANADNSYVIIGDLTIKDMTKSVILDASIVDGGMTATFDLPRKEFNIGNDSYGDKLLDDTVPVKAEIVFEA